MKAIKNLRIYDFQSYQSQSFVVFDQNIQEVGEMSHWEQAQKKYSLSDSEVMDGKNRLLVPNLAICHTHIYSTFARGLALPFDPQNFQEVLDQLWWKLDAKLTKEMVRSSAEVASLGYIQNGVSSVIDHHASGADILGTLEQIKKAVVDDFGLRGMFCFETSDRFDLELCLQENTSFLASSKRGHWGGHFGLHASMSLSTESLNRIKRVLEERPIHVHVAESILDVEDSRHQYGMSVIKRLDQHQLINPDSLIVHGVYLDDEEMDIIAERGAYLVINPSSNMNNGVGLPDYQKMKAHGLKVLLGNDGMSPAIANEWQHLLVGMHHRYRDPVAFDLGDLEALIKNGYDYFNRVLGSNIGRIATGYESDFLLLDYPSPTPMDEKNALGHLFFGQAFSFKPSHLWARGELKLKNYQFTFDSDSVYETSKALSYELWESLR